MSKGTGRSAEYGEGDVPHPIAELNAHISVNVSDSHSPFLLNVDLETIVMEDASLKRKYGHYTT
jgi:hypothetical protein